MTYDTLDFLTDSSILDDPTSYYDYLRECPVRHVPPHGVVAVSGYDEAIWVWRHQEGYSMCNSASGPFPGLPVEPGTDDVSDLIEQHRHRYPISEHMATFDPPKHTDHRALLMRLITPRRLEDSEQFLWGLADRLIDEFHASGRCNFVADYAYPYALLSIAYVLGVPEEDHAEFLGELRSYQAGSIAFLMTRTSSLNGRCRSARTGVAIVTRSARRIMRSMMSRSGAIRRHMPFQSWTFRRSSSDSYTRPRPRSSSGCCSNAVNSGRMSRSGSFVRWPVPRRCLTRSAPDAPTRAQSRHDHCVT